MKKREIRIPVGMASISTVNVNDDNVTSKHNVAIKSIPYLL